MDIANLGKGAVKDKLDIRDYRLDTHPVFGAVLPPAEYDLSDKVQEDKNQNGSLSCGGQAFAYYMSVKTLIRDGVYKKLSAHDLYAPVRLPGGGSRAGDLLKRLANAGIAEEADISSYMSQVVASGLAPVLVPPSEAYMQMVVPRADDVQFRAMQYWIDESYLTFSSTDPEQVKKAIFIGDGAIIAVLGNNECWTAPGGVIGVPKPGTTDWGHFVYLTGYKMINGVLHFKFKNSWGKEWGDNGFGYLPAAYLQAGFGYSEWTVTELPRNQYGKMSQTIGILKNLIELVGQLLKLKK